MKLTSLLNRDFIRLNENISSVEEAVNLMAELFQKKKRLGISGEGIVHAIMEREKLGGTSFPTGLAVPHARMVGFDDLVIGICIPETPFDKDGINIRCVVVILTSINVSNTYLQTLATLIKISRNEDLFSGICAAESQDDLYELITDIKVKDELTVSDIMSTDVRSINETATLGELADLIYSGNISYVPVLDSDGFMIGEVRAADLLKVGIPGYALMMENLKFLKTLEPFEDLLRKEDEWYVDRIMHKPALVLSPDSSVIEAAMEMTQHKRSHLPVLDGEKLVGVLHINDFINKIIRG